MHVAEAGENVGRQMVPPDQSAAVGDATPRREADVVGAEEERSVRVPLALAIEVHPHPRRGEVAPDEDRDREDHGDGRCLPRDAVDHWLDARKGEPGQGSRVAAAPPQEGRRREWAEEEVRVLPHTERDEIESGREEREGPDRQEGRDPSTRDDERESWDVAVRADAEPTERRQRQDGSAEPRNLEGRERPPEAWRRRGREGLRGDQAIEDEFEGLFVNGEDAVADRHDVEAQDPEEIRGQDAESKGERGTPRSPDADQGGEPHEPCGEG